MEKDLLTFTDCQKALGVGRRVMERIWNGKDFPKIKSKARQRRYIKRSAFEEWLKDNY